MFRNLYVYGDSFVHGDTVSQELTWANRLAHELDMNIFNCGVAGGSNKLSIINLLNDVTEIDNLEDTLIIFSWTSIHRTCVYLENTAEWYNILVSYQNKNKILRETETTFYKYMHTIFDGLYNFYTQKILIQSFLKQLNANYFFVNSFLDDHIIRGDLEKPFKLEKFVEKDKYLLGYNNSIRDEVCKKYGLIGEDGFHPSEEGHYLAMQLIKNELERMI